MSIEAISHIMRTHIPDGVAKLVAMVLADYADPVTGRCWPKIPTLAIQCSQCERTVQRKLKVLEDLDVLHVEPNTSAALWSKCTKTKKARPLLSALEVGPWVREGPRATYNMG